MFTSNHIKTEVVVITPEIAEALLGRNTHNRNISQTNLENIVNSLRLGEWEFNGEAIKIAADGKILDGQHRLVACVTTGIAFKTLIVYGLPESTQDTMDTGKSRTLANVLTLHGYKDATKLAAIVTTIIRVETTGYMRGFSKGNDKGVVTRKQALARVEAEPALIELSGHTHKVAALCGTSAIPGALYYLLSKIDAEDADDFFEKLATGTGLQNGDAILALRNSLIASNSERGMRNLKLTAAIFIKAWNKYRDGEKVSQLKFRTGGANPERFPEPK